MIGPVARLPLLLLLLLAGTGALAALDLSRPPDPREIRSLAADSYPAIAHKISEALMAAYVPGARGRPGISGNPAFSTWLDFYRGCDLLVRPCSAETIPLVRRYFFRERATGKIFFLETGVIRPEALESLPESELAAMAEHQQIRARLEEAALPQGSTLATGTPIIIFVFF